MDNLYYVTSEVYQLLKEKGYFEEYQKSEYGELTRNFLPKPSLYEVAKWLREKHEIHVSADYDRVNSRWFYSYYSIGIENKVDVISDSNYDTFEEALHAGIFEVINLI